MWLYGKCCPINKCTVMEMDCLTDGIVTSDQFQTVFTGDLVYGNVYSSLVSTDCGLEVLYPANQIGGSSAVGGEWTFQDSSQERWLSYCIEFDDDFQFVLGGKMPGLGGGSTPSGGVGGGCGVGGTGGYSLRLQWGGGTGQPNMQGYLYYQGQNATFGEYIDLGFVPQQGTKYAITMGVDVGTAGNNDGWYRIYVNGVLRASQNNINFICTGETWENDAFMFSTFYGGNTQNWAPSTDQTAIFSEFCVANTKQEVN